MLLRDALRPAEEEARATPPSELERIALSRLVHDNTYCSEYAARIIERDGAPRQIAPIRSFERRLAYRLREGRPWLTADEVAELAALRAAYRAADLPERVKRALRRTERSTHSTT